MFLSTKLMPRSDSAKRDEGSEGSVGSRSHIEAVEQFNDSVDDISNFFNDSVGADDVLSKLVPLSGSTR
ncbi:unnamed protein product [Ectocarpus sp. 12 AP-2014]